MTIEHGVIDSLGRLRVLGIEDVVISARDHDARRFDPNLRRFQRMLDPAKASADGSCFPGLSVCLVLIIFLSPY